MCAPGGNCGRCCTCLQANVRFNGTLMQNQKLRDDIYSLRVEKGIYDNIYSKVSDKLVSVKHDVNQIIDETTQAFELRCVSL